MFSALKRLTGRNEGAVGGTPLPRHGLQSMSHNLQRKFARGVQYNMKIIIKGDRNVGKTCLFHRLKGEKFFEEYSPTNEIQVASIQWSYKATDDVVKVEVWDVVDRGNKKKKKATDGLKLDNKAAAENEVEEEPVLDAEFLDVYKGTNGVIMVMDITKSWTFDYIQRELPKVPENIPVLVLANHCDMAHHRAITSDHVLYFIESIQRPSLCAQIRYAESSMRNGFGLKFLHKFLNLPFLQLQRETLLAQLETNSNETKATVNELDLFLAGPDADYNEFLQRLVDKRRQAADSVSVAQSFDSKFGPGGQNPSPNAPAVPNSNGEMRRSSSVPGPLGASPLGAAGPLSSGHVVGAGHPIGSGHPIGVGHPHPVAIRQSIVALPAAAPLAPPAAPTANPPAAAAAAAAAPKTDGIMSKLFKKSIQESSRPSALLGGNNGTTNVGTPSAATLSVEEFVPDGGIIDRSFLEDSNLSSPSQTQSQVQSQLQQESDSEDDVGVNPLVAGFEDDVDSEDEVAPPVASVTSPSVTSPSVTSPSVVTPVKAHHSPKNVLVNPNAVGNSTRKSSTSSVSSSGAKGATLDDETVLDGEVSTITGDALDAWFSRDSKWRRSPEGGEDSPDGSSPEACSPKGLQPESSQLRTDSDQKKKSRQKDKFEERGSTKKHKKKDKEKEKKKKKPSRKEERLQNELQEFLNGTATSPGDSLYEPL